MFFLKKKVGQPRPLFVYFRSFKHNIIEKALGFSEIQTRIVGVEGEHADHLTTTTARFIYVWLKILVNQLPCALESDLSKRGYLGKFSLFSMVNK